MAQELGKIDRPEAGSFKKGRKIFVVPLIYSGIDAPPEYTERFDLYWNQAAEHVRNLEAKVGKINRVYHESIGLGGEDGLRVMERLNPRSYQIARGKCENDAELEATEDRDMVEESMDWERCLMVGFVSAKVARKVSEFYLEVSKNRYEHIGKRIEETLQADEIAVLFIREGHMVQFPEDIEVFSVMPPALDEIHRWLRDRASREEKEAGNETQPAA